MSDKSKKVLSIIKMTILRTLGFLLVTVVMLVIMLYTIMWICVNGPSERVKNLFVMSVKETSAVGFLANIYLSEEEIKEIMDSNQVVYVDEDTDTSLIEIPTKPDKVPGQDTEHDKKDEEKDIEIVEVKGSLYKGKLAIIKDPSRVMVGSLEKYGEEERGMTILEMANYHSAALAVNAGGFKDEKGLGLGGEPIGMVIAEGELKYGDEDEVYEIGGFTKDNVFIVGRMTPKQALAKGVRDAVSFGPILVVNKTPATVYGTGGGLNPRTAIGQREDGAVLILVIDGRQTSSMGASYQDLINIMMEHGAVNAFNLDGGSSSVMCQDGKIISSLSTGGYLRPLPTTIIVRKKD